MITKYIGSNSDVVVPPSINGIPVTSTKSDAFNYGALGTITIPADINLAGNVNSYNDSDYRFKRVYDRYERKAGTFVIYSDGSSALLWSEEIEESLAQETPASDFTIVQTDDGVTITGYKGTAAIIVIPHEIAGRPVTVIGERAFAGKELLTHVVIPNTVITIGGSAFFNNKIVALTIPDSVVTIASGAFGKNTLYSVSIGKNIQTIGNFAFGQSSIVRLTIEGSPRIEANAFQSRVLRRITFANTVFMERGGGLPFPSINGGYPSSYPEGTYTAANGFRLEGVENPGVAYLSFGGYKPYIEGSKFSGPSYSITSWTIDGINLHPFDYTIKDSTTVIPGVRTITINIDRGSRSTNTTHRDERDRTVITRTTSSYSFSTNGPVTLIHNFEKDKRYRFVVTPVLGDSKSSGNSDSSMSYRLSIEEDN
jgi:hypothetical protein